MKILLTGAAGFIGYHLALRLHQLPGVELVGVDSLNDYYEPDLKRSRLASLQQQCLPKQFRFHQFDLQDSNRLQTLFQEEGFDYVIHLAAQAGVRYSLEQPQSYIDSNMTGFLNMLEACRKHPVKHLIFASSSSVYGLNRSIPFKETDPVGHPVSLYAATKRSNELMAHSYSHLFGVPVTGLRFFTVYGPYGRPDMAYFSFTQKILRGEPIQVYNYGNMRRDFTYIDDVTEALARLLDHPPVPLTQADQLPLSRSTAPFALYNIGNHQPVELLEFIRLLEQALGKKALIELQPMQPGDVETTFAEVSSLAELLDFHPQTPLAEGLRHFANWYLDYYKIR